MSFKLIVGLGNIGDKYKHTRHNIGFDVVDKISTASDTFFSQFKNTSLIGKTSYKNITFLIAKPTTYMNLSGIAVREIVDFYKIDIKDVLIIIDDCNLQLGKIRFRPKGSAGGHNGLKSIIQSFGTENFSRLRIGIGSPKENQSLDRFVLDRFNPNELQELEQMLDIAQDAVFTWLTDTEENVMQKYNGK